LHPDGSPHVIRLRRSLYGTSMPGAGAVHHIKSAARPEEADAPLHVDAYAVLAGPVALEAFEPVAPQRGQILQLCRAPKDFQASISLPCKSLKLADRVAGSKRLRPLVLEAQDHRDEYGRLYAVRQSYKAHFRPAIGICAANPRDSGQSRRGRASELCWRGPCILEGFGEALMVYSLGPEIPDRR
jgi:hypothetical protein